MAVEIPVFVDIEKALNDAASRVPAASKPLEQKMADIGMKMGESLSNGMKTLDVEVDRISQRVSNAIMKMQKTAGQGMGTGGVVAMDEKMAKYANTVRLAAQQMLKLGESIGKVKADGVNIQGVSQKLSVLANEWKSMKLGSKFDDDGKLRVRAQQIIDKMSRLVAQATKFGNALANGSREAAAAEQAHINALMSTGETLDQLNTRLAAWKKELLNAEQGSTAFKTISKEIQTLLERIQNLNNATKIFGGNSGSINQVSAAMQSLNQQYAALSESDRRGAAGKKLIEQYKQLANYMDKGVKDLNQMYQLEQRLTNASLDRKRTRQYENAVLNSTANTMHRLSEQARILSERLNNAKFGTKQYEELEKKLAAVQAKMQQMQGTTTRMNSLFTSQSTILRNLTSYASMYVSVFGFLRFVKQIRDVTGELEYQRVALGRLIQDMDYGNALFEKIKESATKSPFRIKELVTYTKQLAAYQIEEEKLFDTTKRLADVSAGLGVDMNRLILAYGQVRAASVLRGQELRQFTEAGIPLVDLLAEKMGELNDMSYSTADVFKLISARAVPFSAIADIFEDLTDKGGMFYKMQEEQAKTLKGRWEKLKDQYDIALQSIGESKGLLSFKNYNNLIINGLELMAKGLRVIPKLLEGGAFAWVVYSIAVTKSTRAVNQARRAEIAETATKEIQAMANLKGAKFADAYTAAMIRQRAATTMLTRSFWKLWAAIVANPWGAAIAGVIGLITAFFSFRKATDSANTQLADFKAGVEELSSAYRSYEKNEKLINTYEALASNTARTDEENKKLTSTIEKLTDIFPGLSSKINDNTDSLKNNVSALRDENEELLKTAREEAKQRLEAARITKDQLEKTLSEQLKQRENAYKKMREANSLVSFYHYDYAQKDLDKWTDKYNELDSVVQETRGHLDSVNESISAYEKYLNEDKTEEVTEAWKEQVKTLNNYKTSLGNFQIFTPQEIKDFESVYDYFKELKKKWKDAKESADGLKAAYESATEAIAKARLFTEWKDADALFQALETQRKFFGFNFTSGGGSGSGYKQDPFINRMNERMKFMQDFKKGYDDLAKYMTGEGAMDKQLGIMEARGLSIGLDAAEQKRAAKDLSKWYEDAREMAFEQAKKHGARGTIEDFLRQDIKDTSNKGKALKDFQKLIQSLWDAQTDLDTSNLKQEMEDALKKLEDELKRSETIRNFYHDIFDLTGDDQLATDMAISVYGDPGKEFAERIRASIQGAIDALDIDEKNSIGSDLMNAIKDLDFRTLMSNLDKLPEKLRKPIQDAAQATEKYNTDIVKNYAKLLNKFDEMSQQRINIENQANKEIQYLREGLALELKGIDENIAIQDKESAKKAAEDRVKAVIDGIRREERLQLSRLERDYRLFFSSVGVISDEAARTVARNQKEMLTEQFNAGQKSLAQYKRELREIDEQLQKYSTNKGLFASYLSGGVDEAVGKMKEYSDSLLAIADASFNVKDGVWLMNEDDKNYIDKLGKIFGGKLFGVSGRKDVFSKMMKEFGGDAKEMKEALEGAADEIQSMSMNFSAGVGWADLWVKNIGGLINVLDDLGNQGQETAKWWDEVAARIFTLGILGSDTIDGAGDRLSYLNEYAMSGFEKFKSGDFIGALTDNIKGWYGVFGPNIKRIDKDIKQQTNLLDDLEYAYSRLDVAIEKAFGAEYIYDYNKQLDILQAKVEAYQKQAELERSKGKKTDEDKVNDYLKQARDAQDEIADMQAQLSEFFSGTDLTSAAEDFADAWIEAYKEFGSTTDAMSEKFNDMIDSMINRSLAAKIMQEMLAPIFEQIDTMSRDGLLSTEEISSIAALAQERIPLINDAMTNLMTSLSSAGLDVRTSTAGLSGISKSIAGASEESILGLAAAVNTQNFYMSFMPTINENVATILSVMTGGSGSGAKRSAAAPGAENVEVMPSIQQMVYDHLPVMDQNLAEMLRLFKSVLTAKNSSTNTNYIAVK